MASLGLRLMPPESYITPLPTRARCPVGRDGRYDSLTMRGGSVLPALTPRMPPQPSSRRASASNTSTFSFDVAPTAMATSAMRVAVRWPGRRVGEVARQLRRVGDDAAALGAALHRRRPRRGDDERQLAQPGGRRLPLQRAVAVAGQQDTLDDGLGGDVGRRRPGATSASVVASAPCLAAARANAAAASRSVGRRQVGGVADADRDQRRPVAPRHDQRLADLGVEPGLGERRPVEAELARHRALGADRDADDVGRRRHRRDRRTRRRRASARWRGSG